MNWKESKLRVVVWSTMAMLIEAGLVLWPLGIVLAYTGALSMSIIEFVVFGLGIGLVFGLIGGPISGLGTSLVGSLIYGLGTSLVAGLGISFSGGLVAGLIIGLIFSLVFGLGIGLVAGLVAGFGTGFVVSLVFGLVGGLAAGLGVFAGVPLGILLCYGVRELGNSGIESVKQFFTPWRAKRLYFGRSVGFFVTLYLVFVLLFALWFYASYLSAAKGFPTPAINLYFKTQDMVATSNFWTFTYFSFITIASLGYGDIYPTHWFSQILVILETMVGMGLIAGFLAMILSVAGRDKQQIQKEDNGEIITDQDERRIQKIDPYIDTDL